MKTSRLALLALLPLLALAQSPEPGRWRLERQEDGPMGTRSSSQRVCLSSDALKPGAEQALLTAAAGPDGPRCQVSELERKDGGKSRWKTRCDTPRGPVEGTGEGQTSGDAAELRQSLSVQTPLGSMNLRMQLKARREGDC